ncbi:hypothetical protein AAFX91_33965 [Bradyrhizobium sp. 31Argb]|jgi:hypothetical protein|uniref:hypothetical protein n=1 Tax=Bradyrhizobium TaxID=374 RepID=UPI001AD6D786|nr:MULTISPECIES: hypothetical protein [Bradyrhizobium]MDI4232325.1 hypothetical protein [Bradyrhizobium sp. Arg237L]
MTDSSSQGPAQHSDDEAVDAIVRAGPGGAIAVAGIATAIVVALWFAFYLFVFLPRSA